MNYPVLRARRPTVVFLNSCVSGGGAGKSLLAYLDLEGQKLDAHVIVPEAGVFVRHLVNGERVHIVPEFSERLLAPRPRWLGKVPFVNAVAGVASLLVAAWKIALIIRRVDAEVVYCNHMLSNPLGLLVGKLLDVPVIFHIRNIHNTLWAERWFYRAMAKSRQVRALICNSCASAQPFGDVVSDKVSVIYNFCDLVRFDRGRVVPALRRELSLPPCAPVVGYLGRITPWKGVDLLIDSFARVRQRLPEAQLVIVGANDPGVKYDLAERYRRQARRLGLAECVHFVGYRDDVRPHLVDFDLLVLPSRNPEPFGRVLLEAMALGVPPVIAAHGGATEVVRNGEDGLWSAPGREEEMADKILCLLTDGRLRSELAENGTRNVRRRFDGRVLSSAITHIVCRVARGDARLNLEQDVLVPE